jgi:hypothetical protein
MWPFKKGGKVGARKKVINFPAWDQDTIFYISVSEVVGALAYWAVKQSPYDFPENLSLGLFEFVIKFRQVMGDKIDQFDFFKTNYNDLSKILNEIIAPADDSKALPVILSWNTPKKEGACGEMGCAFVSRFNSIKPDYDFIDLDALSRNIANIIFQHCEYNK